MAGILEDFSSVEDAMKTMEGAAGSADREMGIIRDSLEYKINSLKQTWVGTLQDVVDRGDISTWIDRLTKVSEALGGIISNLGFVKTAIVGVSAVIGSQRLGLFDSNSSFNKFFTNQNAQILNEQASQTFLQRTASSQMLWDQQTADSIKQTASSIQGLNQDLVDYTIKAKTAGVSSQELTAKYVSQTSVVGKLKTGISQLGSTAVRAFKMMANALVTMAITTAIMEAIQGVQDFINSSKKLAEAVQNISSEYRQSKENISEYAGKIKELRDVLANQESTTQEVADATAQLYDIQNELVGTYEGYATGLDLVNGKLSTQLRILEDIDKQNAQQAVNKINDTRSARSSFTNAMQNTLLRMTPGLAIPAYIDTSKKVTDDIFNKQIYNPKEILKDVYFEDTLGFDLGEAVSGTSVDQITEKYENFNYVLKDINDGKIKDIAKDLDGISFKNGSMEISSDVKTASESITTLQTRLQEVNTDGQYDDVINKLQKANKEASDLYQLTGDSYNTIMMSEIYNSEKLLDYYRQIQTAYSNIEDARNNGSYDDIQEANKQYVDLINNIKNTKGIEDRFVNFFEDLYPDLQNIVSEWELEVKIIPNMDEFTADYLKSHTQEEIMADYAKWLAGDKTNQHIFKGISEDANTAGFNSINSYISAVKSNTQYSDNMLHAKDLLGKNWKDAYEEQLTEAELEAIATIKPRYTEESQAEYDKAVEKMKKGFGTSDALDLFKGLLKVDDYTLSELKEQIEDYINPIEVEAEVKSVDAIEGLDKLQDTFGNLSGIYETTVTNSDVANASDIEQVNSDFGGTTFDEKDIANVNALSNAIEAYNDALVESKGDATAAQEAIDELVTAYIDQSGILDDLTDENKDYYISQLKANGITNAQEVVESRLGKQAQITAKNIKSLSEAITQNRTALDKGVDAGKEYTDAVDNISSSVADLLSVYDDQGTKVFDFGDYIDSDFITDNLGLIESSVEGDIDALNRLRVEAAKQIVAKVDIQGDPNEVKDIINEVDKLIDMYPIDDIKVGTYLNDTPLINGLNNLVKAGKITRDDMNSILSGIGVTPEITYEEAEVTGKMINDVTQQISQASGSGDGKTESKLKDIRSQMTSEYKSKIKVPTIKYKASGASTGAKASYDGSTVSTSNSGGSGGSGGSDSGSGDSSEETFDWIEVKIERLQEQLEDLGKVADNVYDQWGTRNKAVADQIKTLTDEIQLQKDAAEGYLEKANSIDLSEEYKKKVQEGKIQIETITDQTTIDNINDYTDYWNKYKDAENTVKELSITRSEYQQTLFDNISAEYEDAITNIEKTVDILNEQITRTEEFGFFVDEQYYDKLLDQEKQNYSKLESERNELINKLNEGIEKEYIKPYSEAWNDMYQSIMDVNIAMEESATNTRKLNNEIRQLKWDKFDWVEEQMSDYATEADFLIKLLQGENNYEDDGNFNNRGFAQAALVGAKYNDTLAKMERYKKEIADIDKEMSKDPTKAADKEMIARKQALVDEYRNSIEAAEDEKQAMQSLVQEGINKHLEALQELINKYKESLDAEKDLYDWQKNVADQTKNIVELEKQLAAYEGDTSEEARKKRQELQSQLNSAQQSLEESQWDRYISETGELLDDMYGDYEDYLNGKLEEVKVLMDSMIGYINDNTTAVKNGIDEVKKEYGLTTQNFEGFVEGQSKLLNEWQDGKFVGDIAAVRTSLSNFYDTYVKISEKNTKDIIDTIGKVVVTDSEKGKVGVQEPKPANGNGTTPGSNNPGGGDDKTKSGLKDQSTGEGKWVQNDDTSWSYFNPDGTWMHDTWFQDPDDGYWYYFDPTGRMLTDQWVGDNENEGYWLGDDGRMLPDKFTWQEDDTGWWFGDGNGNFVHDDEVWINGKKYRFNSEGYWYAKGTKGVPFNQLAYTQEDGQELVYRTDSGALLTPLGQGDMVFTNDMTQRLWEIASGANPFTETFASPNISSVTAQTVNNDNKLTVVLPNVESYEDFKRQMKADTNVQQWMQEVTIGQMMGNNKLNKNKY